MGVYLKTTVASSVFADVIIALLGKMQPFNLAIQSDFDQWAEYKLSLYNKHSLDEMFEPVVIPADGRLTEPQLLKLNKRIRDYNFALYRFDPVEGFDNRMVHRLGEQLGLQQLDANLCAEEDLLSVITDTSDDHSTKHRYIPYSTKALGWHTDGYYNPFRQRVQAFILHCKQQAQSGGENYLIDPDIVYLLLRRKNENYISALSRTDVMTIPANYQDGDCIREETSSAVFQVSNNFQHLAMRYSQRKKNICWREDELTQSALTELNDLLNTTSKWCIKVRLQAGEGIISNNVLHRREPYQDDATSKRTYLRARYYNAIPVAQN